MVASLGFWVTDYLATVKSLVIFSVIFVIMKRVQNPVFVQGDFH